ncbi:hypothetical protein INR49_005908, partial [Caranx melampygus]
AAGCPGTDSPWCGTGAADGGGEPEQKPQRLTETKVDEDPTAPSGQLMSRHAEEQSCDFVTDGGWSPSSSASHRPHPSSSSLVDITESQHRPHLAAVLRHPSTLILKSRCDVTGPMNNTTRLCGARDLLPP